MTTKIDDIDIENLKTPVEECCEGGFMSAGCYHDNCTGANSMKKFDLQDPTTWHCFKEVADVIGEEDAEYELGKVLRQINEEGFDEDYDREDDLRKESLGYAFGWSWSVQGIKFWESIFNGKKPEGYDSTPDTPPTPEVDKKATPALKELMKDYRKTSLKIPESTLESIKETFTETRSQTLGELVEDIQANIPEHLGIHFQPDGEVLLESDNAYVVVSELTAKEIDSAIEFVAHYGHLVIGKNVGE